ncbi:MAG: UbiA family prenyltransferase [Promethearchaeota archaeon]
MIKTSRPLGWIPAQLGFLAFSFLSGAGLVPLLLLQMALLSFPYCIFLYGINDIYDYESDKINPRKESLLSTRLEPKDHALVKRISFAVVVMLVLSSLITLNLTNILAMLILLFFSYFYSAPPIRFKEKPPFDSISNGIIVYGVTLLGFSFGGTLLEYPLKGYFVIACIIGLHAFSTVMDYSFDKEVGERTFAVVFGKRTACLFAFFIFISTSLFSGIQIAFAKELMLFYGFIFLISTFVPSERLVSLFFIIIVSSMTFVLMLYVIDRIFFELWFWD